MISSKNIDNNLGSFRKTLAKIRKYHFSESSDDQIKEVVKSLRERSLAGDTPEELMPECFAAVDEAVKRTLSIKPFDVQLIAAAAMQAGRIIEMPTGEGKTLSAVFVACLNALSGEGVHVLTFNDYLAKRDALWMQPVYHFMGLSVAYVIDTMNIKERKEAYSADVTYVTAKEAGFDYLKSFLAYDTDSVPQRDFHFAIIDEADSILIDEARVPLVIAGDMPSLVEIDKKIYATISRLTIDIDFETDEYANNIFLTEAGAARIEGLLGLDNLYDAQNSDIQAKINMILQAEFLLKKDIDYIVRNDQILLVDEFTGRIVKNRQWSDGLQAAVERKEGLVPRSKGVVMNRITLQNFLKLYPNICGMTGTACSAAPEFMEFYNKTVTVIPPHIPCIRVDYPDVVFTHKDAKFRALAQEIHKVNATGRPILVGTGSVEESEALADLLKDRIADLSVLNARNDSEEAEIISNAGKLHAVTISTNMAGRGVDIKLGGKDAGEHEQVCLLGGLYVIGTNRYESVRVDNQLRGRAGRQGDPGESRFFISLEDSLIVRYRINDAVPPKFRGLKQDLPLDNPVVNRAIVHTQRVVEGQIFDAKLTLAKYSYLADDQRAIVNSKRRRILDGESSLSVLENTDPSKYQELLTMMPQNEYLRAQKEIELYAINKCWADYLLYVEGAMDGVQVISMVKGDPFTTYNKKLIEGFEQLEKDISQTILEIYDTIIIRDGLIDLREMGVTGPTSTRTYLVHDGTELQNFLNEFNASISAPLYAFYLLIDKYKNRKSDV
jgi:preprotein translocase subunit SecA